MLCILMTNVVSIILMLFKKKVLRRRYSANQSKSSVNANKYQLTINNSNVFEFYLKVKYVI